MYKTLIMQPNDCLNAIDIAIDNYLPTIIALYLTVLETVVVVNTNLYIYIDHRLEIPDHVYTCGRSYIFKRFLPL